MHGQRCLSNGLSVSLAFFSVESWSRCLGWHRNEDGGLAHGRVFPSGSCNNINRLNRRRHRCSVASKPSINCNFCVLHLHGGCSVTYFGCKGSASACIPPDGLLIRSLLQALPPSPQTPQPTPLPYTTSSFPKVVSFFLRLLRFTFFSCWTFRVPQLTRVVRSITTFQPLDANVGSHHQHLYAAKLGF